MFKKFSEEYTNALKQKENKSSYNKASLISLIFSVIFTLVWIFLMILTHTIHFEFARAILIIVLFVFSYIINPIILCFSILFLVLQWKITFNKYTICSLIGNVLLLTTIILSIFII